MPLVRETVDQRTQSLPLEKDSRSRGFFGGKVSVYWEAGAEPVSSLCHHQKTAPLSSEGSPPSCPSRPSLLIASEVFIVRVCVASASKVPLLPLILISSVPLGRT